MPARKRAAEAASTSTGIGDDDRSTLQAVLAHLNFSSGKPDPRLLANLNLLWPRLPAQAPQPALAAALLQELDRVSGTTPVFSDCSQARGVIELTLNGCGAAYREFHADLLFHQSAETFDNPFFVGRMLEAVLAQGSPWEDRERILSGAVRQLNDFAGYRPVAVLENGRQMELYAHERFGPVPLYVQGAGVASGRYAALMARTLEFLREAPQDLLLAAFLDPDQIGEIVLDVRAHDHLHPVNKRTNYTFGEWDPHTIDTKGRFRRFVIRQIVIDALVEWTVDPTAKESAAERLFDAAAALCGTMLMAASVSGAGPDSHDSTVSLTTLLPIIARRRDEFYTRLMSQATGARAKRLKKIEQTTRQPFGHVRQYLNMHLAGYGARQVQRRELALLFAGLGFPDIARSHAAAIPAASIRIECECLCELSLARDDLRRSRPTAAADRLQRVDDLLQRGIACGAIVDPWNILGFGGQFPLFQSREDAIPDNRVESLLDLMEETFNVHAETLVAAALQAEPALSQKVSQQFQRRAGWWDQFASDVIEELPPVLGQEAWESATHVADMLRQWRAAGQAAGDVTFWKQHLERFHSAHSYGPVVQALLEQGDHVASFALMMQWLGQLDDVGIEGPQHSLLGLLIRWMTLVTDRARQHPQTLDLPATVHRLFAFLEANAGDAWGVPTLEGALTGTGETHDPDWINEQSPGDVEPEDDLYSAAFDGVTFKDTADDGHWGDTLDESPAAGGGASLSEFELLSRELEPRLKFLNAVGQLWQLTAVALAPAALTANAAQVAAAVPEDDVHQWRRQCRRWESELLHLMDQVVAHAVDAPSGETGETIEFDLQLQVKYYLLNQLLVALLSLKNAERMLAGCVPGGKETAAGNDDLEAALCVVYSAVVRRDADSVSQRLPSLLRQLQRHPLLYVPFDHGGEPLQVLRAQTMQSVARFLLRELPRLGLLRHTWHLLNAVYKMERRWRPEGQAITEFDRLFDIALRQSVLTLLHSAETWSETPATDDLLNSVGEMLEPFQQLWMKHSRTMRLSSVDGVRLDDDWAQLYDFVQTYGGDLFHASQLTLGHVRTILHHGVRWYIDYLRREQDPLHPLLLIEHIDSGKLDADDAVWCLETLYAVVVDKFDRFLEYNTTTTQSDYGQMFYTLLDFLRLEARYDREAWNLTPLVTVHDLLCRLQRHDAARIWAGMFEAQTAELAARHLGDLQALESQHGMRLPAIRDHLNQRLFKVLNVNEMTALIRPAVAESRSDAAERPCTGKLAELVETYLRDSWGSGIDIPHWIRQLDREASEVLMTDEGGRPGAEAEIRFPQATMTAREFRQQINAWRDTLSGPSPRRTQPPATDAPPPAKPSAGKRNRGRKRK